MDREALRTAALQLLRDNDLGDFIKPSRHQYPHIWNWDAAFIALGLSRADPPRARAEVRALLAGQWGSGMVPHILYPTGASDYFPTPDFWRVDAHPGAPAFATSGFTQPPILASVVRTLQQRAEALPGEADAARAFGREVYPQLLAWHRWLRAARDPHGSGLVAIVHPWESGTDNSPRFQPALERLRFRADEVPSFQRGDRRHVDAAERPLEDDYQRFMYLIGVYRELRWDDHEIWRRAPFLVHDALFNAILLQADRDLLALAREQGRPAAEIDEIGGWLEAGARGFDALWDDDAGVYFDRDLRTGELLRTNTVASLMPLYAGVPDADRAARLLREQLLDPEAYAPGPDAAFAVPSVAKREAAFEPRRYWRGPVWINANWLLARGLERYGYAREAAEIDRHSLELVTRSGFVEYYDPRDGSPCGARGFSWSAALTIEVLDAGEGGGG